MASPALDQEEEQPPLLSSIKAVRLSNGVEMPEIALGTAPLATETDDTSEFAESFAGFLPEQAYRSITVALESGICHLDTAYFYRTHKHVGHVLAHQLSSGRLKRRQDVFLTSKVFHSYSNGFGIPSTCFPANMGSMTASQVSTMVQQHCDETLVELGVGYVDLMLLHWPGRKEDNGSGGNAERRLAAWKVLENMYRKGWARAIGVSNFSEHHLQQLQDMGATVVPMVNQIEASVFLQYNKIVEYCRAHEIVPAAYSPLGRGVTHVTSDETVQRIAAAHGKDAGQVALKYLLQKGYAVVYWTSSESRVRSNAQLYDFELSSDEMAELDRLNRPDGTWGLVSPYEID